VGFEPQEARGRPRDGTRGSAREIECSTAGRSGRDLKGLMCQDLRMHAPGAATTLDVSGTRRIPFGRLTAVELRKSADTRAGRWLIGLTAGIALVADFLIAIIVANQDEALAYGDQVDGAA